MNDLSDAPRPLRRPYAGETYYDRPALKPAPWEWLVGAYIGVAGLAGGAQVLATLFRRASPRKARGIVRNARWLAIGGSAAGGALLVADLRTPRRFYNMMRIFRPTSPMSIGTYVLLGFSGLSGLTLLGELPLGRGRIARAAKRTADAAQLPAAVAGAAMGTYTAALLSATSTPVWAASPRHLGAKFAASSIATSAAALSIGERLGGRHETADRLDAIAAMAAGAQIAVTAVNKRHRAHAEVASATRETTAGRTRETADLLVAGAVPLAAYAAYRLSGNRQPGLALFAAAAVIAGGFLSRDATIKLGQRSAERPRDYFRFAQEEHLPAQHKTSPRENSGWPR
ncbi:NrfD/PsrC family molybdoenzyme membrane anchor subunit [Lutibaculum baratangense]|uniref:Formate dehydrogenase O putative subunit n=1 Tax=Lutibaculum baratangense AMV1 TaxID=631454 RepID=V4R8X8_9HYPH|nr:NrfD/PsrC family molybdoenzyme membrane anchor subunit [Lutibaculum baratangense]ESR22646.1 Formate dehydrogenase O putative subunit [Lutibaculum baratangense AMV1]